MNMSELNCICLDCKLLKNSCSGTTCKAWTGCLYKEIDDTKKGMIYIEKNPLWNLNNKIKAKFSRLNIVVEKYIYVGLLTTVTGWTRKDYIDIMSYFDCIGFEEVTEEEAKKESVLPTGSYQKFLKLQKLF